jgi:hypothetical protein
VHNTKIYFGGYFDNEKQAAMKVNLLCDKFEIERKNPTIYIKPDKIHQAQTNNSKYSKYSGVTWMKDKKKWLVRFAHNKNKYYGGIFDIEEDAAMEVNLLCDKYGIERKNTIINNMKTDTIIQPEMEPIDPDLINSSSQDKINPKRKRKNNDTIELSSNAKEKAAPFKDVHSNEKIGKCQYKQLYVKSEKPMHGSSSNTQEFKNRINIIEELQSDPINDSFEKTKKSTRKQEIFKECKNFIAKLEEKDEIMDSGCVTAKAKNLVGKFMDSEKLEIKFKTSVADAIVIAAAMLCKDPIPKISLYISQAQKFKFQALVDELIKLEPNSSKIFEIGLAPFMAVKFAKKLDLPSDDIFECTKVIKHLKNYDNYDKILKPQLTDRSFAAYSIWTYIQISDLKDRNINKETIKDVCQISKDYPDVFLCNQSRIKKYHQDLFLLKVKNVLLSKVGMQVKINGIQNGWKKLNGAKGCIKRGPLKNGLYEIKTQDGKTYCLMSENLLLHAGNAELKLK